MSLTSVAAPPEPQIPGYEIEAWLADGGMASVYIAWQVSLQRRVAIKVLRSRDSDLAQRFEREARLLATISHRHVLTIYDVGHLADGRPFLAMELLQGGSLRQRLEDGALHESDVRRWFLDLAGALATVHAHGIIHRDIKPGNILFRQDGSLVLCDFGIAFEDGQALDLTRTGLMVGSPAYASPEQLCGRPIDARSDQYSLGVLLVECLLGRNPFRGQDYGETLMRHLQMPPQVLPAAVAPWQAIVDSLLAKEAAARYADEASLLQALQQLPAGSADPLLQRLESALEVATVQQELPVQLPARRRRWPYLLLIGLLLLPLFWVAGQTYRVHQLLLRGDARLEAGLFLQPAQDSALFYYRQALLLQPHNAHALAALTRIARGYRDAALIEASRHHWQQAQDQLQLALQVRPDAQDLLALRERLLAQQQAQARLQHAAHEETVSRPVHHAPAHGKLLPHWLRRWIGG